MANNQNINQFNQTVTQGQLDLRLNTQNLAVQLDPNYSSTAIGPGQSVKIVDSAQGGVPIVTPCTADTDDIYGFVNYDPRINAYSGGDYMTISFFRGNVMYMTASAAIARNAKVMVVISSTKIATATTGKTVSGRSIDKAAADGDLIRVVIDLPGVAD